MTNLHRLAVTIIVTSTFFVWSQPIQASKTVTQYFSDSQQVIYFPLAGDEAMLWVGDKFYYTKYPLLVQDWQRTQIDFSGTGINAWADIIEWSELAVPYKRYSYVPILIDLYTEKEQNGFYGEIVRLSKKDPTRLTLSFRAPEGIFFTQLLVFDDALYVLREDNRVWFTKSGKHWSQLKNNLPTKTTVKITATEDRVYAATQYQLYSSKDFRHWKKVSWNENKYISKIASTTKTVFVLTNDTDGTALYGMGSDGVWETVLVDNNKKAIQDIHGAEDTLYVVQANYRALEDPRGDFKERIYYILTTNDGAQFTRIYEGKQWPETIIPVADKVLFKTTKNYHQYLYQP